MPVILVVDDSEMDRRLVGGLLPQDLDWLVEFADNGVAALEKMRLSVPDLVVTDMMMPEMDGMELVSRVRVEFPDTPVILITAHGSEMRAVEALQKGATSYVPKPVMAEKLRETVEQVLALSRANRSYSRLVRCLTRAQYDFALDNDPTLIPPLVDLIQQMLAGMEFCDATGRMHAGIALEEAMLNALLAGNLEMQAQEVQTARQHLRQGQHWGLVESRRQSSPFAERTAWVRVNISPEKATFVIRDEGQGFDVSEVPDKADPEHLEHRTGRGLVLMKNFMDDVQFSPEGNEVTMTLNPDVSAS
ncbi:MAG: response regulator [Planctomycetota bacterium]